ncbi:D-alanine--D-alanine ligase family protein [Propionibacteriaceae bacterium Y2011]|uniref:D-alanine--D-alanine ligase family protein n=1 Tax=Microlunatus sp. Y2014 TaxID=3418488 RepID=UPI003B49221B
MAKRPRVAIVFGGVSHEHAISCLTAASVVRAIDQDAYEVVGLGITPTGQWIPYDARAMSQLQIQGKQLPAVEERTPAGDPGDRTRPNIGEGAALVLPELGRVDVAFTLLHGPYGEDGTVQGLFEMLGVRYVGSGVLASAVGMDKHHMKNVLTAAAIPVGPFVAISPREWEDDRAACLESVQALEFPVFVKPARGGSSLGITKVADPAELERAVEHARHYDPKVLVEQGFVDAREIECGVLETPDGPRASVVGEIVMHTESGFYDFESKYLPEETVDLTIPADLPEAVADEVRSLSVQVFNTLGCEGLARVDFFLTGDGRVHCNEINTMPGFTALSMFPQLWAASGVDYPELVDTLLQQALARPVGLR